MSYTQPTNPTHQPNSSPLNKTKLKKLQLILLHFTAVFPNETTSAAIARSSRLEGPFEVSPDGIVKFKEKDGIDYAVLTVQLPGGGRVPFHFTVKQLVASGKPESFSCEFLVPRYRGSSFLDPKGKGGSQGYDNAAALPPVGEGMRKSWRMRMSRTRRRRRGRLD
ncbi:unnamed protein product [Linum trigynum]|uniref:Uncharacterized protein n=1 Tax=Linum trigynum TaxID=586398 RepID=A0AAV2FKG9_9ROSI